MFFQARLFNVAKIVYTLLHYSFPSKGTQILCLKWKYIYLTELLSKQKTSKIQAGFHNQYPWFPELCWNTLADWTDEIPRKFCHFSKSTQGEGFSFLNLWLSPILFWSTVLMTTYSYESIKHFHMSRLQTLTSYSSLLKCSYPKKKIIRNIFCFWMFYLPNYVVWFLFLIVLTFCLFNTSSISFFTSRITI